MEFVQTRLGTALASKWHLRRRKSDPCLFLGTRVWLDCLTCMASSVSHMQIAGVMLAVGRLLAADSERVRELAVKLVDRCDPDAPLTRYA